MKALTLTNQNIWPKRDGQKGQTLYGPYLSMWEYKNLRPLKFKAFIDDKVSVIQLMIYVYIREGNFVEKGENAGYHQFLLSLNVFKRHLPQVP